METKEIGAAKFKETCLALLDSLGPEGIVITKHGKPVAKLIPIERASGALIGTLRSRIRIRGGLLSTGERWEADAEP